ncbi:MAG TPA: response regulator transcription factor [Telluria sp.]|nr:response regulator transcription factor [Telluria sp.]
MIRVVIADDHTLLRDGIRQILSQHGDIQVTGEAANGHEALNLIRQQDCDVLLLDMAMPGRSGLELLKQIRHEAPRVRVLVLSMQKESQYAVRCLKAGAAGYLCKDSAASDLVRALCKVADGGSYVGSSVAENIAAALTMNLDVEPHAQLSDREFEVFRLLATGHGTTTIARQLHLSVKTVSAHKGRILQKMNLANTADLVRYAFARQLVQ